MYEVSNSDKCPGRQSICGYLSTFPKHSYKQCFFVVCLPFFSQRPPLVGACQIGTSGEKRCLWGFSFLLHFPRAGMRFFDRFAWQTEASAPLRPCSFRGIYPSTLSLRLRRRLRSLGGVDVSTGYSGKV
jgi:hypothetical protein